MDSRMLGYEVLKAGNAVRLLEARCHEVVTFLATIYGRSF